MTKTTLYASASFGLLCLLPGGPAFAQAAPPATPAEPATEQTAEPGGLQDIIVTAQRRSENLQKVPISVVAITADELANRGLSSLDNIAYSAPSLNITRQQSSTKPFLRGEGSQDAAAGNESSVAIYVDDVYLYTPYAFATSFNNIQQVEVLKGPQGTLYGRNAFGGLINIRTKDPQHEASADATLGYSNYNTVEAALYATGGLTDTLAADIAVRFYDQGKGFGLNYPGVPTVAGTLAGTPVHVHKTDEFAIRSKWLWTPGADTRVTFAADYARSDSDAGTLRHAPQGAVISAGLPYIGETYCGEECYQNDLPALAITTAYSGSLRVDQSFGGVDFTSITGYRRNRIEAQIDQDGSPRLRLHANFLLRTRMFSQELQLKSPSDSAVKWIIGAFYMDANSENVPFSVRGIVASGLPGTTPPGGYDESAEQGTKSRAAFAQASVPLGDKLTATVGGRFTSDRVDASGSLLSTGLGYNASLVFPGTPRCGTTFVGVIAAGTVSCAISQSNTFNKLTWRGALDYQLTDDVLLYLSGSRGFKAGVYNLTRYMDSPAAPQTLDAFEVGTKTELFDRRVRFNTALYYYLDKGLQLTQNNGATNILTNAAAGRNYGGEVELTVLPTHGLTLNGSIAYTHARYRNFPNAPNSQPAAVPPGGNILTLIDASGFAYIQAPDVTANVGASYAVPTSFGDFDYNVSYYYNDGFFWEANNRLRQPAYGIVNMSLKWTAPKRSFDVRLWVNNLTNTRYQVFGSTSPTGDQVAVSDPRRFGVTLGVHF